MTAETSWQKSSFSAQGSNCLELTRPRPDAVLLRESAEPDVVLAASSVAVGAFLRGVRAGEFAFRVSTR